VTKAPARIAAGTNVETKDDKLFDASLASPVCPPVDDMLRGRKQLSAPWRAIERYYLGADVCAM